MRFFSSAYLFFVGIVACFDVIKTVAKMMDLDTKINSSLWRDRAVVELNAAVLYSFQVC